MGPQPVISANKQIARSAFTVMGALVVSQLVGLAAKSVIGSTFGTGIESEAFFAANRFAEILFNLVAGGALASAFIPTFTGLLANDRQTAAWKLAASIANLVTLILVIISILSALFAPQVVRYILAPGFAAASPEKEQLTISLLRLQLPSAAIFGISGLIMGILNAHQRFLLPALAPALYQLGLIFGVLVLSPILGVHGLGWGVLAGALLHLAIQLPALLRLPHAAYSTSLGLELPEVREVARLMGPRLLGVAVVQLNFLLNTYLASLQPEGSLTGISLAFPLMIMPQVAIAQSLAIAALPTFSRQAALGKLEDMRASLAATLRGVLILTIPATLGLILLRRPLVALIYQRQAFSSDSTELVAWALLWYAVGLVGHSVVEITSRAFYALHDTRTPVVVGVAAMSLNLVFSLAFSWVFSTIGWMPHGGLALANSLATFLEMIGLLYLMRRRLGGLAGRKIWHAAGISTAGAIGMGASLALAHYTNPGLPNILQVLGGAFLGVLSYALLLWVMRMPELRSAWLALRTKVLR